MANRRIPAVQHFVESGAIRLLSNEADGCRAFEMDAYTGAPVDTYFGLEVIDLKGLELPGKAFPILRDHSRSQPVGYSSKAEVGAKGLVVAGKLTTNEGGAEVARLSDEGFPWQASVGVRVLRVEEVKQGDSKTVNGRKLAGPLMVITKSRLMECSFVPLGADGATSARALSADGETLEVQMSDPTTTAPASDDRARLSLLKSAFPGRAEFVLAQFEAGNDVTQAKAALADILLAERPGLEKQIEDAKAETAAAKAAKAPVGALSLSSAEARKAAPAKDEDEPETFSERAQKNWKADKALRAEFAAVAGDEEDGAFKAYCAYLRAEERGLVAIKSVNGTITR
jgi:hypothetical protein